MEPENFIGLAQIVPIVVNGAYCIVLLLVGVIPVLAYGVVASGSLGVELIVRYPHNGAVLALNASKKDDQLAQKLGQLQPFIAVFRHECMGQLASFGQI
jgi:hypothetical protein